MNIVGCCWRSYVFQARGRHRHLGHVKNTLRMILIGEFVATPFGLSPYSSLDLRHFKTFSRPPQPCLPTALSCPPPTLHHPGHIIPGSACRSSHLQRPAVKPGIFGPVYPSRVSKPHRLHWHQTCISKPPSSPASGAHTVITCAVSTRTTNHHGG